MIKNCFNDKERAELKEIMLEVLKEYHSVPDWQRTHPHWILGESKND